MRLQQTYRGLPVVGGELIAHPDRDCVLGVNGQFVPGVQVPVEPKLSKREALAVALARVEAEGGTPERVAQVMKPVINAREGLATLAIPVMVYYAWQGEPHLDIFYVDATTGRVVGLEPRLFAAKYRTIHNLNQKCIVTSSELPRTFMFSEGDSSSDQSAMGGYNGTATTYDFY